MISVLEHLEEARNHLIEAKHEAPLGTARMISESIDRVQRLIDRTERIHEGDTDHAE